MKKINRLNIRIEVLVMLAVVHHMRKQDELAMACLGTALDLACPGGWIRSFIDAGQEMITMLAYFLKTDPDHQFAKDVLEASYKENGKKFTAGPENDGKTTAVRNATGTRLTKRETQLLPFLAEGLSNKEIAVILSISDGTVKVHLKNMFRKLNATNRIEAVNKACRMGIIDP